MSIEIQSYFAEGERYPVLIGVRAEGDEYETAYVSKSELVDALAENAKLQNDAELLRAMLSQVQTEKRCYMADNAELRERVDAAHMSRLLTENENERLRELVRDMWRDGMCECDERGACAQCEYHFLDRMRELGIEVDE